MRGSEQDERLGPSDTLSLGLRATTSEATRPPIHHRRRHSSYRGRRGRMGDEGRGRLVPACPLLPALEAHPLQPRRQRRSPPGPARSGRVGREPPRLRRPLPSRRRRSCAARVGHRAVYRADHGRGGGRPRRPPRPGDRRPASTTTATSRRLRDTSRARPRERRRVVPAGTGQRLPGDPGVRPRARARQERVRERPLARARPGARGATAVRTKSMSASTSLIRSPYAIWRTTPLATRLTKPATRSGG